MKNPNIAKVDSKGRILIPMHVRKEMGMEEGTEIIILPEAENNHAKLMPLVKDRTVEVKIMLKGSMGCIGQIGDMLAANNFNILLSESRRLHGDFTEWKIIADVPGCNGKVKALEEMILNVDDVKNAEISVK